MAGLVDALGSIGELEIRQWFSPFGDIDSIELPKDQLTGKNKGHAIIEYHRHRDAKNAVKEMNGFDMQGRQLKCSIVTDQGAAARAMMNRTAGTGEYDLEEDSAH